MHCSNCYHYNVCGNASRYNDVSMCKQFIRHGEVLCGPALKVVDEEMQRLQKRNERLNNELKSLEVRHEELEREVELLRIIKQTLEMQSGMKFDI